jgi:hydrogenase-4 component B
MMSLPSGSLIPLLALTWPLLMGALAAVPAIRPHALRLLPLAPLPALWLAALLAWGDLQMPTEAPDLLLGVVLGAQAPAALLFGTTAALWFMAAIYAQGYMAGTRSPAVFTGFWCLTFTGNLGVFLAADVATFYVSFAAVSLAAYFLVVHSATQKALRAGRIYAVLVILGEVCLLLGFVIGASAADSLLISEVRAALPVSPLGHVATGLLVTGFGVKAGLIPLHVWLPLAHPAAPTPASAVLSGAIVKAGIVGLMLFLAPGMMLGNVLIAAGFFSAFAGALLGLTQRDPKAILAYSTISQMGVAIALIGAALQAAGDMRSVAFYAAHHGLAKGALFLSVGVVAATAGRWRAAALAAIGVVALSVAGAPLTGGGLTKAAAKTGLGPLATEALTLSAVTTTMVLVWFLYRLSLGKQAAAAAPPGGLVALPTLALAVAALALPWLLWSTWSGLAPDYVWRPATLWSAFWPILAGLALLALAGWWRWRPARLPEGDIIVWLIRLGASIGGLWQRAGDVMAPHRERSRSTRTTLQGRAEAMSAHTARLELVLSSWRNSGLALIALILVIALAARV